MTRRCKDGTRDHRAHPCFKPVPPGEQRYVLNRITPNGQRHVTQITGRFPMPLMIFDDVKRYNLEGTFVLMSTRPRLKHIATVRTRGRSRFFSLYVIKSSHPLYKKGNSISRRSQ
jgi:hypothetical protein